MPIKSFKEQINLALYDSKKIILPKLKLLSLLVSIASIGALIYYYGFPLDDQSKKVLTNIIKGSFAFYIGQFIVRLLFELHRKEFLINHWFESVLMIFLVVEGISYNLFDTLLLESLFFSLGVKSFAEASTLFIQIYFLIVILVELAASKQLLPRFKLHPALIFIASFLIIILAGTGFLMLPEMTVGPGSMSFLDALFTSTSATCVTGLAVEDTATFFSFRGHLVILILIKLGGLNIIAFGTFITLAARLGLGVKHDAAIEDFVNKDTTLSASGLLRKIVIWSIIIELIGAVLIFFTWLDGIKFSNLGARIFSSLFHSVSAFNNAGLSLFTDGIYAELVRKNYTVHLILTVLIFLGALGFNSIFDLFDPKKIRKRRKQRWRTMGFSTKIAWYFSIALVVIGTVLYFILEYNNTLKGMNFYEAMVTSLFQSVNRTSGFSSVDTGAIGIPMLLVIVFLMFVGSSSSSTGGGIKTSTFGILWAATLSIVQGKKNVELFKRTIPIEMVLRAFAVFIFFVVGNLICILLLTITETEILSMENRSVLDLIFEEVSAIGTVGLSTGITSYLSVAGKTIIIISMFVGRVGTLTVAFAFGKKIISTNYKYPTGHTLVG